MSKFEHRAVQFAEAKAVLYIWEVLCSCGYVGNPGNMMEHIKWENAKA